MPRQVQATGISCRGPHRAGGAVAGRVCVPFHRNGAGHCRSAQVHSDKKPFYIISIPHMCGRFTQTQTETAKAIADIELPPLFKGRYNVAPTQPVVVIRQGKSGVDLIPWGFATQHAGPVINARQETLREKPMFKSLLHAHRCLILADGYYEWNNAQPYYFQLPEKDLFAFAGLWRTAPGNGAAMETVILTRSADSAIRPIHDRMPVIVPHTDWSDWLEQCRLPQPPSLAFHPVSRKVNNVSCDDPSCIQPAPEQTRFNFL